MTMNTGLLPLMILSFGTVMSTNYHPLFNDALVDVHVVAGQTAVLPCTAQHKGEHKIIWMNPKRILFSQEDSIVIDDRRVGVQSTSHGDWNLRIEHVQHNDSGEYTCQINTSPVKIKRVRLHVQVPAYILNQMSSRDVDVEEGKNVVLTCRATGIPTPNITWFMKPLEAETKEYLNIEGESLFIEGIKRYQSGYYVCLAYNGVPPATTREMLVKVQYIPIVRLLNTRLGQSLGKETILECSVTSHPRAKTTWYKNDVAIQHSYKYRLELYPGKHDTYTLTLQILHINKYDYGDYTCEAENRMGKQRATMTLYEYKELSSRAESTTNIPLTTTEINSEEQDDNYYPWQEAYQQPQKKSDKYGVGILADGGAAIDVNNKNYRHQDRLDYLKNSTAGVGRSFDVLYLIVCLVINYMSYKCR